MSTTVAILMRDTLRALGLKQLLESSTDVVVKIASGREEIEAMGDNVDYVFTDVVTQSTNIKFFIPRLARTIVVDDNVPTGNEDVAILNSTDNIEKITSRLDSLVAHSDKTSAGTEGDEILSRRETDVLRLVASGLMNKEIAERLNISINTVLTHRKNITAKLGIKSASGLSFYALMNGIITP